MPFCTRFSRLIQTLITTGLLCVIWWLPYSMKAQVELNTSISPISTAAEIWNNPDVVVINENFSSTSSDSLLTIQVTARNFRDIVSMQFSINWDPSVLGLLGFSSVDNGLGLNSSNINGTFATQGELPLAWLSSSLVPVNLEEESVLFLLHFAVLSNLPSEIYFDDTPTPIEFVTNQGTLLTVTSSENRIELAGRLLRGQLIFDENKDCMIQSGEAGLRNWMVEIDNGEQTYRAFTDPSGKFAAYLDPATYTIRPILPENNYWQLCESEQVISILESAEEVQDLFFVAQSLVDCPSMSVNISTPFLRRCFENIYRVEYCNLGTALAEDAYLSLELPTEISLVSSPVDFTLIEPGVYRFDLGNMPVNSCDGFALIVKVDCETTELGQTHCVRASVFPNEICEVDQLWSGASLDISATCEGDSIRFDITNKGEGDMGQAEEFVLIQDMIMLRQISTAIQLPSGELETVKVPANGATYRLEMRQVPFHPTDEQVSASIEGCGISEQGTISRGFINMFERSDDSPFVDEDCQENIGAFDPNDKTGYPLGYGPQHQIDQNKKLTYHIRFQNTGTDTAFNIVLLDTLSEYLNVSTFQTLAASHEYQVVVQKENILKFSFNDIQLVDSVKNEPLSHGFVRFSIEQQQDISLGTVILNEAAIYFDFNEPVITNTTEHTVGKDFIEQRVVTSTIELPTRNLTISPNPFYHTSIVTISQEHIAQGQFTIYDVKGQVRQTYEFQGNQLEIQRNSLPTGMYLYEVVEGKRIMGRGKIIVQE